MHKLMCWSQFTEVIKVLFKIFLSSNLRHCRLRCTGLDDAIEKAKTTRAKTAEIVRTQAVISVALAYSHVFVVDL